MEKKLKSWQGWLLFGGTMVVVFVLGMIAASVNERHAEVTLSLIHISEPTRL